MPYAFNNNNYVSSCFVTYNVKDAIDNNTMYI